MGSSSRTKGKCVTMRTPCAVCWDTPAGHSQRVRTHVSPETVTATLDTIQSYKIFKKKRFSGSI